MPIDARQTATTILYPASNHLGRPGRSRLDMVAQHDGIGIGTDIIEISRIKNSITRFGERFLKRVYTEKELGIYLNRPHSLAARFAAKEAVIKTLGTRNIRWTEIEILADDRGKPHVYLYGKAQATAQALRLSEITISIAHCREYATACAAAVTKD